MREQDIVDDRYEVLHKSSKENLFIRDPFDNSNDEYDNYMDYRMILKLIGQLEQDIEYNERSFNYRLDNIDEYLSEIIANKYLSDDSRKALEYELNENSSKSKNIHEKLYQDIYILYSNQEFYNKYIWSTLVLEIDNETVFEMSNSIKIIKNGTLMKEFDIGIQLREFLDGIIKKNFKDIIDFGPPWELLDYQDNHHVIPVILEHYKEDLIDVLKYLSKEQAQELCDPLLAEHIINQI
jgi:hypothetical protein